MKVTGALLIKEWKQVRWYLLAGLAVFVGLPLIVMWSYYFKRHLFTTADASEALVVMFGGLFAIFTAAGLVCPELKNGLAGFWRSRPIAVWKWALVKYIAGLLTVLIVCTLPLILELYLRRFQPDNIWLGDQVWTVLTCHTFVLILVYSVAFLVSILVRRPTHAILLSAAVSLMIYFLPLLIPALEKVSILNWITHGKSPKLVLAEDGKNLIEYIRQPEGFGGQPMQIGSGIVGADRVHWGFWFGSPHWLWLRLPGPRTLVFIYYPGYWFLAGVFLLASLLLLIISILSLHLDWRVQMNQKFLVWSLGLVALLLFASAAFTVGSNLTCEETIHVQGLEWMYNVKTHFSGSGGIILSGGMPSQKDQQAQKAWDSPILRCRLDGSFSYETFFWDKADLGYLSDIAWNPERPDDLWLLTIHYKEFEDGRHYRSLSLMTLHLNPETQQAELIDRMQLAEHISDKNSYPTGDQIVLNENRLYAFVFGQLKILDVSDPAAPRILKTVESWYPVYGESGGARMLRLIPDDELMEEQRWRICVQMTRFGDTMKSDGRIGASVSRDFIRVYRFDRIEGEIAYFKSIGQRIPTPLERLLGNFPVYSSFKDGLLYVIEQGEIGGGLTVYEISPQGDIRRAGHYAVPEERLVAVTTLSDGRIFLVGALRIHILQPPLRKFTQPDQSL